MRRFLAPFIFLALVFYPWNAGRAQSEADVSITFTLAETEPTVGDLLHLTLDVRHPAGWQVLVPQARQAWQGSPFEVRSQSTVEVKNNADGSQTSQVVVTAAVYTPGKYQTPPWKVTVNTIGGEAFEQAVPAVNVEIESVLKEGERDLRDLKPQADLPVTPMWTLIVAAFLILATLAGLAWWYISRRRAKKNRAGTAWHDSTPPWQAAMNELNRIEGLGLLEKVDFKQYYSLTTDCLRLLIERQFNVSAIERTTAEIRRDLRQSPLAPTQANAFIDLLGEADLVKFAKFVPNLQTAQTFMERGRAFVEAVKPDVPTL